MKEPFYSELRSLLDRPETSYAELLGLCLRYINDDAWCDGLTDAQHDNFLRFIGSVMETIMRVKVKTS